MLLNDSFGSDDLNSHKGEDQPNPNILQSADKSEFQYGGARQVDPIASKVRETTVLILSPMHPEARCSTEQYSDASKVIPRMSSHQNTRFSAPKATLAMDQIRRFCASIIRQAYATIFKNILGPAFETSGNFGMNREIFINILVRYVTTNLGHKIVKDYAEGSGKLNLPSDEEVQKVAAKGALMLLAEHKVALTRDIQMAIDATIQKSSTSVE